MNQRDLKLGRYNISKEAYRELKYFCLRYPEMKRRLADIRAPLKGVQYTEMPRFGGSTGDPTRRAAELAADLSSNCEMIEQSALEAAEDLYPYLMRNVTQGVPFDFLQVPQGRTPFFAMRRRFFFLLARRRNMI